MFFNFCVDEDEDSCRSCQAIEPVAAHGSASEVYGRAPAVHGRAPAVHGGASAVHGGASATTARKKAARILIDDVRFLSSLPTNTVAWNCNTELQLNLCHVTPGSMLRHLGALATVEARKGAEELGRLLSLADARHSDLLPGEYEGGLKVWECTHDVVRHLCTFDVDVRGLRVLELGCGAGFPGIVALSKGAEHVCFQDYNEEVLRYLTVPNVYLNASLSQLRDRCSFYSGDWGDLTKMMVRDGEAGFDLIITAETIYSSESQSKLLGAIKELVAPRPSSVVLVAAKTVYFGVGGSLQMFRELVEHDGCLKVIHTTTVNAAIPRQILTLKPVLS